MNCWMAFLPALHRIAWVRAYRSTLVGNCAQIIVPRTGSERTPHDVVTATATALSSRSALL